MSETASGVLAASMWSWAALVSDPVRATRQAARARGEALVVDAAPPTPGGGPLLSRTQRGPRLLDAPTKNDGLVEEFDRLAEAYDFYVRPFSVPLFSEALDMLAPLLTRDARVLDAGCGPGRELRAVARRVPDGEVVGVDLAAGMVVGAHRAAWAAGLDNTAFVQSDVGDLPRDLDGAFDLVYNCLAHHHYPDPAAAAAGIRRCLRPGGHYAIIDPGPEWFVRLASALSLAGDPGWIGFHTPEQFRVLPRGRRVRRRALVRPAPWVRDRPGARPGLTPVTGGPASPRTYTRAPCPDPPPRPTCAPVRARAAARSRVAPSTSRCGASASAVRSCSWRSRRRSAGCRSRRRTAPRCSRSTPRWRSRRSS